MPGIPDLCRYCPVERGSCVTSLSFSLSFLPLISLSLLFARPVGILHKGALRMAVPHTCWKWIYFGDCQDVSIRASPVFSQSYSLKTASHPAARLNILSEVCVGFVDTPFAFLPWNIWNFLVLCEETVRLTAVYFLFISTSILRYFFLFLVKNICVMKCYIW